MFRAFMFVILFCASSASAAPIRFSSDVLPILASKCFTCHGPDAEHRKAGLRLDQNEGLFGPLKSGDFAVVPGDTSKSVLFHRITTADSEEVMPPTDAPKPLSDEEKQTLIRWIEEGAVVELLLMWNQARCNPPMSYREVVSVVRSIAMREERRRSGRT